MNPRHIPPRRWQDLLSEHLSDHRPLLGGEDQRGRNSGGKRVRLIHHNWNAVAPIARLLKLAMISVMSFGVPYWLKKYAATKVAPDAEAASDLNRWAHLRIVHLSVRSIFAKSTWPVNGTGRGQDCE